MFNESKFRVSIFKLFQSEVVDGMKDRRKVVFLDGMGCKLLEFLRPYGFLVPTDSGHNELRYVGPRP